MLFELDKYKGTVYCGKDMETKEVQEGSIVG